MLIDTREPLFPPAEPDPPPRRSLRLSSLRPFLPLLLGVALVLLSGAFAPLIAYGLILVACVLIGRGLAGFIRGTQGLSDHRQ